MSVNIIKTIDLQEKLQVYRRNGVQEYLVWQVSDRIFDWFRLRDGKYIKLQPDEDNIVKSEAFPGLWLAVDALLDDNLAEVIRIVQQGINTKHLLSSDSYIHSQII